MRNADIRAGSVHGKRHFRKLFRFLAGAVPALCLLLAHPARGQTGATFDSLEVKGTVYRAVKVLSVSPSTVTIRHSEGIVQLAFSSLSPELQQRFGYSPAAAELQELLDATARKQQQTQPPLREVGVPRPRTAAGPTRDSAVGRALARFGTAATLVPETDLRPRFRELELGTKSQGLRPSCAVFAVVSALEFQNAAAAGHAEKLSEEYLIWATRRTLGLAPGEKRRADTSSGGDDDTSDAGFLLGEVLSAVRAYGVPLQAEMPNTFGLAMEKIPDPDEAVIASARARREVSTFMVPGVNNDVKIANIVHALNEGVPVVVGLRWPHWRTLAQAPMLSGQTPREGYSHAVTLVGYISESGQAADLRFIFKNSWGIRWGAGGYGFAEIGYLRRNLLDAVVIEVRPIGG